MAPITLGLRLGIDTLSTGVGFSLDAFMASQADGLYFDFTKTDRQFQEAAGFTPSDDPGEAIGLALDQLSWNGQTLAQVLAAQGELCSNPGNPFAATTGFTGANGATVSVVSGKLRVTGNGSTTFGFGKISLITTIGTAYRVTAAGTRVSGAGATEFITKSDDSGVGSSNNVDSDLTVTTAEKSLIFIATATTSYIRLFNSGASDVTDWSYLHVVRLPGNHAIQTTSNLRPLRQSAGAKGDGSDDNELTVYKAGAGANFLGARTTVPATLGATQVILGASGSGANRVFLGIDTNGHACGGVGSDSTTTVVGTSDLRGTQADIFLTFDGSTVRLIVNSVVEYEAAQNSTPTTTIPFRLFANNNNGTAGSFYAGYIKEAVVGREFITVGRAAQISSKLAA